MTVRICIHIFPHEIDFLDRICDSLMRNANYVDTANVIVDVVLNVSETLYDITQFKIPLSLFENKFRFIERKLSEKYGVNFVINTSKDVFGLNHYRRNVVKNSKEDIIVFLDTDVYFNDTTLLYTMFAANQILETGLQYFIITPQIYKFWDNSWDVITNKHYITKPYNFRDTFNSYEAYTFQKEDVNIKLNQNKFKLAGGWFNLFSTKLLKLISIPESFGAYGEDDTYLMYCSDILRNNGWDVRQYILENVIVFEDAKFRYSPYIELLPKIDDTQSFRKTAIDNMRDELIKFEKTIKDII
jgi:hypothetical protein